MLIPSYVRLHFDQVVAALEKRNLNFKADLERLLALDEERRASQAALDETLAKANAVAKEIGQLFKETNYKLYNNLIL